MRHALPALLLLEAALLFAVAGFDAPDALGKPLPKGAAVWRRQLVEALPVLADRARKMKDPASWEVIREVQAFLAGPLDAQEPPAGGIKEEGAWLVEALLPLSRATLGLEGETGLDDLVAGRMVHQIPDVVLGLRRLNTHRAAAGIPPVRFRAADSRGSILHARYLALNGFKKLAEMKADFHSEDATLPGFTPEGKEVAGPSVMSMHTPAQTVDVLIATYIHRLQLLVPDERGFAIGSWEGPADVASCLRSAGGVDGAYAGSRTVVFPGRGAVDVPRGFWSKGEMPPPVPLVDFAAVGFPVTVTFYGAASPADVKAVLRRGGEDVPCWVSTPYAPTNPAAAWPLHVPQSIGMLPKGLLAPATTYEVRVTCRVGGAPWESAWSFTTAK